MNLYPREITVFVQRVSGLAFGLLLANCAGQVDISKYPLPEPDVSTPAIARLPSVDADGNLVMSSGPRKRAAHAAVKTDGARDDVTPPAKSQDDLGATALIERHAVNSRPSDVPLTVHALSSQSDPRFETPVKGSDRWKKEEAENERLDKLLNLRLKNAICSKC